jgi:hypothetical protein
MDDIHRTIVREEIKKTAPNMPLAARAKSSKLVTAG